MPQYPTKLSAARAEKLFAIEIVDAPQPKLTVAEVKEQTQRGWWSRRLRWGWKRHLAQLMLPSPKYQPRRPSEP